MECFFINPLFQYFITFISQSYHILHVYLYMSKGRKGMNENIFRRIEQKYLIDKEQMDKLLNKISPYIECDEYYESTINNIYFDNENNDMISTSLEKPEFKAKVRLRSYGTPTLKDKVFLEVKDKYMGVVGKRRISMTLEEFYNYLDNGVKSDEQIMKELDYFFKKYDLKPFMFVGYDRKSFRGHENKDLRITLDENLRSREEDLKLELGSSGKKYFDSDKYIMEIKTLDSMPMWLTRVLSELKIYPISFSKIGSIYTKKGIGEVVC